MPVCIPNSSNEKPINMAPKNYLKISLLYNEIKIRETRDSEKKMNSIPSRIIPNQKYNKGDGYEFITFHNKIM